MRKASVGLGRNIDLCAAGMGYLKPARDEISVQMGLEHGDYAPSARTSGLQITVYAPVGIDQYSLTISDLNQVRAVA